MSKKLIIGGALVALTMSANGQSLREGYVAWPSSADLPTYVKAWNAGTLNMEDENFFISRVKPKARFRNAATQVNQSLNADNDKRLCFWVPITTSLSEQFNLNALPNSVFDSEVFSMWTYVDVYGNWTSPHGWVPGNFADVAHKNGVSVSGVASIPFGGLSGNWSTCLQNQATISGEDMGKFLYYHGVDGLGYNSEFSGGSTYVQTICGPQHEGVIDYLTSKGNPVAENVWYDGTNWSGGCTFDQGLGSHNKNIFGSTDGKRRASMFFNYNWNSTSRIASSISTANSMGISPLYIYCGMNMQGGEPRSGETYPLLVGNNLSLGYWGAHQYNMFWLNRTAKGSDPVTIQNTYLSDTERFFTNGAQNPAVNFDVYTQRNHYPRANFFGMSKFMTARSTLSWNLDDEPFVTFFNMGNGAFFNWMGERMNNLSWYNIGVQDYLPTWRYWWAPSLLGRTVANNSIGLNATFNWKDAYVGGSCLSIKGTDKDAWLHLFKTRFGLVRNDVITLTYKHLAGKGKVSIVFTVEGAESTPVTDETLSFDLDTPDEDEWVSKQIELARGSALAASLNGKNIALIALHFEGAEGLEMNIGEFSIKRGTAATPAAPQITLAKVLGNHYQGVDGKLIWNMANEKAAGEPCYNIDVKTSLFKLYAKEEGGEPIMIGTTTSWAGLIYNAPFDPESTAKVQFGVSAVSLDYATESEIVWSDPMERGSYTINNDITINKPVIKPGESFEIKYVDPMHSPSSWKLYNSKGELMAETTGTVFTVAKAPAEIGGYDLVIDEGTANARRFGYYVQVSSEAVGAMPEIYTISIDGKEAAESDDAIALELVDDKTAPLTVSYTGRNADGSASRGLDIAERFFGCKVGDLGLEAGQSFSVAFWVKYDEIPEKNWALLDITNRGGSWPVSNWGFCWLRGGADGRVSDYVFRGNSTDGAAPGELKYTFGNDTRFQANSWTHVVMTFDYQNATSFRSHLYLNGVKQKATWSRGSGGSGTGTQDDYAAKNYAVSSSDWLSTAGLPYQGLSLKGVLDDFQIWNKAMTADEVKLSMAGLDANNLPAAVMCFWDFEDDATAEDTNNYLNSYAFLSKGSKAGVKAYSFDCVGGDDAKEGQGTQTPFSPSHSSGCPFIAGTAFPVVTTPEWSAKKAIIEEAQGTGEAGSAKVSFSKEGDYQLTLTLSNSYGKATASYPVMKVAGEENNLAEIEAQEVVIGSDVDGVFVDFAAEGRYVVAVYGINGTLMAQKAGQVAAGQLMKVAITTPGVYVVKVADANGSILRNAKVIKK